MRDRWELLPTNVCRLGPRRKEFRWAESFTPIALIRRRVLLWTAIKQVCLSSFSRMSLVSWWGTRRQTSETRRTGGTSRQGETELRRANGHPLRRCSWLGGCHHSTARNARRPDSLVRLCVAAYAGSAFPHRSHSSLIRHLTFGFRHSSHACRSDRKSNAANHDS